MRRFGLMTAALILLWMVYVTTKSFTGFETDNETGVKSHPMERSNVTPALEVSVRTGRSIYRQGETIKLEASVINVGEEPICLYGLLSWGLSSSFTLHVTDAIGKEVPARYPDDSLTPPPPPDDRSFFVNLNPHHFLGNTRESSLYELNATKPGKYRIVVEYHSPIPQNFGQGLPFWGRENGSIWSRAIQVEVVSGR
jgi:hypothetical protein